MKPQGKAARTEKENPRPCSLTMYATEPSKPVAKSHSSALKAEPAGGPSAAADPAAGAVFENGSAPLQAVDGGGRRRIGGGRRWKHNGRRCKLVTSVSSDSWTSRTRRLWISTARHGRRLS